MKGEVGILNVGAGDTKLTFDPKKPEDSKRSAGIVKDMIRRGFVLLIEVGSDDRGPIYRRALDFDEEVAEYIIVGDPVVAAASTTAKEHTDEQKSSVPAKRGRKAEKVGRRRVPARSTNAVAVARTAGG